MGTYLPYQVDCSDTCCRWLGFETLKTTRKRKRSKAEILSHELALGNTIRHGSGSLRKLCGRRGWQPQDLD